MSIKIEKGIPIPEPEKPRKLIFDEVEVGDSFVIQEQDPITKMLFRSYAQIRPEKEFTSRTVADGVRVWRVK